MTELTETPYDTEDFLQGLLARYPALLAGDLIDPERPRRWLLLAREMGLSSEADGSSRWSVDHLFVDQDAIPTVIEVKRSSDTRIRREVIGQIIEYAANAVAYWPVESLRARFERLCADRHVEPFGEVASLCGPDFSPDEFWKRMQTNLQAGRVRLILVADVVPPELRRMVEFLNEQMDPAEILALEVRQFVSGDLRTLVPRVFGQTEQARSRHGAATTRQWDEQSFFELLEQRSPEGAAAARRILDWIQPKATRIWWGKGAQDGSFVPVVRRNDTDYQLSRRIPTVSWRSTSSTTSISPHSIGKTSGSS